MVLGHAEDFKIAKWFVLRALTWVNIVRKCNEPPSHREMTHFFPETIVYLRTLFIFFAAFFFTPNGASVFIMTDVSSSHFFITISNYMTVSTRVIINCLIFPDTK